MFNLTMTYRLDSDFPTPYGYTEMLTSASNWSSRTVANDTRKLVAWAVSDCAEESHRDYYVKVG